MKVSALSAYCCFTASLKCAMLPQMRRLYYWVNW
jgi:hypothetical protein